MYTQEDADKEYQEYVEYYDKIKAKIVVTMPAHEDSVTFLRLDMKKLTNSLFTDSETRANKDNIRLSWIGQILAVCSEEHPDEFLQKKKLLCRPGRCFYFNPEVAYSLNLPDMYHVWTLSLNNIMNWADDVDPLKIYKETLQKRVELFLSRK